MQRAPSHGVNELFTVAEVFGTLGGAPIPGDEGVLAAEKRIDEIVGIELGILTVRLGLLPSFLVVGRKYRDGDNHKEGCQQPGK
jgi:hypothetical protein